MKLYSIHFDNFTYLVELLVIAEDKEQAILLTEKKQNTENIISIEEIEMNEPKILTHARI
jgi:hypothetical protein